MNGGTNASARAAAVWSPMAARADGTTRVIQASDEGGPMRSLALLLGLSLLFLRMSMLHQILDYVTGVPLRLLYIVGIPALLGVVVAGGIQRAFRGRPTLYWVAFVGWLIAGLPFSSWRGGSALWLMNYLRADFIMLFITAGLVVTWKECRWLMYTMGWAAAVTVLSSRIFNNALNGRIGLEVGTVKNPDDFAGHLLLVLPFLLWMALSSKSPVLRVGAILAAGYGVYVILASGSRGAFVALIAAALFYLVRGTARQRIAFLATASIAMMVLPALLPQRSLNRLRSVISSSGPVEDTAESTASRRYLMDLGIKVAFQHPVFGIGQGQFANYEGINSRVVRGIHGQYQEVHNSYIAAASECGLPAFFFFVAGVLSSFRLLNSTFRQARLRPECQDIKTATFCIMLAMVGFCVCIAFLNFTYFFYLPAMAGISVAVYNAAQEEFRLRSVDPS